MAEDQTNADQSVGASGSSESATHAGSFAAFVEASPMALFAAHNVTSTLVEAGFTEMCESDVWTLGPGRYVVRRDGAVIAFVIPEAATAATPWRILGAHTDSPSLRVKATNAGFTSDGWQQDSVEVYGGAILSTWFDRDLEFAGRLVLRDGSEHLVRTGAVARVPHLAIHLDRSTNSNFAPDAEQHLQPIIGAADVEGGITGIAAACAGIPLSDVAGADLFAVDTQAPARIGAHQEFLASPRMDNLVSTFAGLNAMLNATTNAPYVQCFAAFDHEEIGSSSWSGAAGSFLGDVWQRVALGLGDGSSASSSPVAASAASTTNTIEPMLRARARSWVVSMDVGHLVHPNYSHKHDPRLHPQPGRGPLLKVNANQRYMTNGLGEAFWAIASAAAGVPYQVFVSNNDVPCGSTIGPMLATRLGVKTVDVGAGILSMHSVRELIHIDDLHGLAQVAQAALTQA